MMRFYREYPDADRIVPSDVSVLFALPENRFDSFLPQAVAKIETLIFQLPWGHNILGDFQKSFSSSSTFSPHPNLPLTKGGLRGVLTVNSLPEIALLFEKVIAQIPTTVSAQLSWSHFVEKMRQWYQFWQEEAVIAQQVGAQIPWGHNLMIVSRGSRGCDLYLIYRIDSAKLLEE
jgi:hypothetical protein